VATDAEHGTPEQELDQLREAVLDDWLIVTSSVTDYLRDMQTTFSWRVTRPLRLVRRYQRRAGEIGVVPAGQLAAVALARKFRR
jgi:hypothetical protein